MSNQQTDNTVEVKTQTPAEYFEQRMNALGVTAAMNQVQVWQYNDEKKENELVPVPIFKEGDLGIKIYITTLGRLQIPFTKQGAKWKHDRYNVTRLITPRIKANGDSQKYDIPKGQGTYPFFHPDTIAKFEAGTEIETLFITEGFFKAFKGCMHGLDVVGVSSITHLKDKDSGKLHSDIRQLIRTCKVKRVVWLTDGDCLNISGKEITEKRDLYTRPKLFFSSATLFQDLLSDFDCEKWFAHILSEEVEGQPKGLDDLLCALPGSVDEVVADLKTFGKSTASYQYAYKCNITYGTHKLHKYFNLNSVNEFYLFHVERRKDLKGAEFKWNGTHYQWDEDKNECKVIVPAEASDYFRVGDQYHEFIEIPNKYGEVEKTFHRRQKSTIMDDHGKEIIRHVPRYKAFCSVPDHLNYQQVIHNNFNLYAPFEWEPAEEDCSDQDVPATMEFLRHVFGTSDIEFKRPGHEKRIINELDLGLDYLQLLYQKPTQILPILCLVSKENGTGKTTLGKWLKLLYTANCAIVGNAELADNFNASWASKLLIICDEAKIDKQIVVEKVKSLSTADKVLMNAKGKDHVEIDFFGKFIFFTNNEESFIPATEDDVRFWVRKVPVIKNLKVDVLQQMHDEIPAFLNFLNKRKMVTEMTHRAWIDPQLLKTDALKRVIAYSKSTVEKELRVFFRDKFFDFGIETLFMTRQAIHKECFNMRYEANYMERVLKESLKLDQYHVYKYDGKRFDSLEEAGDYAEKLGRNRDEATLQAVKEYKPHRHTYPKWSDEKNESERKRLDVNDNGRHYIIHRHQFLTAEEIENLQLDPEQEFITQNITNQVNKTGIKPGTVNHPEMGSDEDPFK